MKYLIIEDKSINIKYAHNIVRKYYPRVRYPNIKRGIPQFCFEKSQLTEECACEIAKKLGLRIITKSKVRVVIGY